MDAPVEVFVLHARPYRESSQLVELLTVEQGRVGVIVRGSRGARRGVPLLPFCRYRLQLAGRGELRRAQGIEAQGVSAPLAGRSLFAALYLNELLVRLLHRDMPVPGVFDAYAGAVGQLAAGNALEVTLRFFEKRLLEELGYGHRYAETVEGEPVSADGRYTFDPEAGVRASPPGLPASQCYRGSALIGLDAGVLGDDDDLRDAKRLMRRALAPHLGDRPLRSRALFQPVGTGVANPGEGSS